MFATHTTSVMTLPPSSGSTSKLNDGIVLIEVDDILEGGNDTHRKRIKKCYAKYQCGKRKNLQDLGKEGALISGIRIIQNKDFSFNWRMNEYVKKSLSDVVVP